MSLEATAALAGISLSLLGYIERGEKPILYRGRLEALAQALRISPADLTGQP